MAKNNKYTAINFNHIYEKSITTIPTNHPKNPNTSLSPSSSLSHSYSAISSPNKPHGRILVLTRPTPKPKPKPVLAPPSPQQPQLRQPASPFQPPRSEPGSDAISLRPLGRTGTGSSLSATVSNRDNKDKEPLPSPKPDKFVPPHRRPGFVPHLRQPGHDGSDMGLMGRPRSSGNRPSSSGWYVFVLLWIVDANTIMIQAALSFFVVFSSANP